MVKAGLAKMKDGKIYDVFRNRVMFPIINVFDKVIGFGGRVMDKDGIPKYLNTTNTPIYDKRHNLYGFNNIKKNAGFEKRHCGGRIYGRDRPQCLWYFASGSKPGDGADHRASPAHQKVCKSGVHRL